MNTERGVQLWTDHLLCDHIVISRTCRARFPADPGCLDAAAESRQLSRILAFLGGPREARGRLRRRAPYGAGRLRRRPLFARQGLASLGLAKLRKWLNSAGALVLLGLAAPYAIGQAFG